MSECVKEEPLPREGCSIIIRYLLYQKHLLRILDELQICPSPLLETKIDDSVFAKLQQVFQCRKKQRKCGLEVDAVSSQHDIRLFSDDLCWQLFTPSSVSMEAESQTAF